MQHPEDAGGDIVHELRGSVERDRSDMPGPSPSSATNLIIADVAMRAGSYLLRGAVEKGLLRGRYGKSGAENIVDNRSVLQRLTGVALAKVATRSAPGAVLVGGGILAKTLFDRSQKRRARRRGDAELAERAAQD